MSQELLKTKLETLFQMPPKQAKEDLPPVFDEILQYGTGKILEEIPDLLSQIIKKMLEADAATFLSEKPDVANKFMGLLWEGVSILAAKSEEFKSLLAKARDLNINFEAADSPLAGHFSIRQGKISGGPGLFHFKDQDFRFLGPTRVLLELLTGKLALGFHNPRLQTEGHPAFQGFAAPIIRAIPKLIEGKP